MNTDTPPVETAPTVPAKKPKKKRSFKSIIFWLPLYIIISQLLAGGLRLYINGSDDRPRDEFPRYSEIDSYGEGEVKVVRIFLDGIIMRKSTGGLLGGGGDKIAETLGRIRAATQDEDVRAILFEVNSPGGGVTPSDEIYMALMRFKESAPDRKIVVYVRDLAASGGYYAALAGDWIIAEPTSLIGSIGVMMQSFNFKHLADLLGIRDTSLISGENKDLLNPLQEPDPAQMALVQELIDIMYKRFRGLVVNRRGLDDAAVDEHGLADGRVFTAEQALAHGLIDQIGYFPDARAKVGEVLGEEDLKFVRYGKPPSLSRLLFGIRMPAVLEQAAELVDDGNPRMMYLWRP